MTNVLVKKIFFLAFMLSMMAMASAQSISYNSVFDLSGGATFIGNASVAMEETQPYGLIFNDDGTKVYTIGYTTDGINQYSLSTPFDITDGISHDGSFVGDESFPTSLSFNNDGSKLYITGSNRDRVNQYSLSVNYDITSTVTSDGFYYAGSNPTTIVFSPDGTNLFIARTNTIEQYSLSTPYDVTSTVTSIATSSELNSFYDIRFSPDGKTLVLLNYNNQVETYYLETGFDVSSNITKSFSGSLIGGSETIARAMTLSGDGSSIYILGQTTDAINQFDLNPGIFSEAIENDGSIQNPVLAFTLDGDLFNNPGGTLTYNTDYQITNLPTGLNPILEVSEDGARARLTLTGQATNHQDANDVASLTFTFTNSAFVSGDASSVAGSTLASSGIGIDFRDNSTPLIAYDAADISSLSFSGSSLDVSGDEVAPTGMTFNDDGTKLFIVGTSGDAVVEYSLSTPYDLSAGASATGNTYDISNDDTFSKAIEFSADGSKMFILGSENDAVIQYSLSVPFDITSTVTKQGTYSVVNETVNPGGFSFSKDGLTLYVVGPGINDTYVYSLTNAYDITSGVSLVYTTTLHYGEDITFSQDGKMVYFTYSSAIYAYSIETPFYLGYGGTLEGTYSVSSEGTSVQSSLISPDRSKLFVLSSAADVVNQYDLNTTFFEESFDDNGSINGSMNVTVVDDQFTNAGSTLTHGVDFTVSNIPSGITPVLTVANDGLSAELTLSGNANNHAQINNLNNLIFNFTNSAFIGGDASIVLNASSADSYYRIEYKELEPIMYSSSGYDVTSLEVDGSPLDISSEDISPGGLDFNADGTKLYMIGSDNGLIAQYSLTVPYDINGGVTLDGTYTITEETLPIDMAFSNDGTKLFVIGFSSDKVNQYSLSTPFDVLSTVTHEGDVSVSNGLSVTFSSDGSRMYTTFNGSSQVTTWLLNEAFDITQGYSTSIVSKSTYRDPVFSPDGRSMFVTNNSSNSIDEITLSEPFDISTAEASGNSFNVGSEDATPLGLAISPDGTTFIVAGSSDDELNQYKVTSKIFTEVTANSGAVDGSAGFTLRGDSFVNIGSNLTENTHYTITGIPAGLSPLLSVSAGGSTATLSFTGNATEHQNTNDEDLDLTITFLDAAFAGADASAIRNSNIVQPVSFDFNDNGSLSYTPTSFYETYQNEGEIEGSMLIQLIGETFTNAGSNLTEGEDYSIANIPSGLVPEIAVAANGLSAILTFSGAADNHQDANDLADLIFTFENSAFTNSEAQYIFNAVGASSGSSIDFEDNNPRITYGNQFDLSDYPEYRVSVTYDFTAQEDSPGGMAFSNDGMKMFIIGYTNDEVFEYNLTSAFDVSNVTYSGNSYSPGVNSPSDLVFDPTGTTMFIMDASGDEIEQFNLSAAFDLSSTVSHQGTFEVSSQDIQPSAMTFSPNGKKMYMIGSSNDKIFQYTLTSPFDITSGISYDGVEASVSNLNYTDIQISEDGKNIFLSNSAFPSSSNIRQYELNTPFDIEDGISAVGGFYFHDIDYGPTDFVVSPDRKRLIVIGAQFNLIYQFDLDIDGFEEISQNNGEVEGSLHIEIDDDTFANAGSTMTYGSDYSIDNLPSGLSASMTVAADGYSATVSLSGAATNHQDVDDTELTFTFNNSAFVNSDAADVQNAVGANSTRMIDYRDNNPALSYGNTLDMDFASATGTPLDVSSYSDYTSGIIFSNDGMKMFISVYGLGTVYEYALSSPYDLTGASQVASYDHSAEDMYAEDLAFSTDGMKMFVLGSDNYTIYQYNLTSSFDISTGVSYSGISFSYEDYDSSVYGFTFNPDGSKLYLGGGNENAIMQFTLSSPYDLSTFSFDDQFDLVDASPTGMKFSSDGRYIIITNDNDYQTIRYRLNEPYDVTQGGIIEETFDLDAISVWPSGLGVSPDGSRVFIADGDNYEILQYNVDLGDFTETLANDGSLEGTARIYLVDDTFANAGGTLVHGADYTINNLPSGISSTLTVDADGYLATLTLTGSTSNHGNADDIPSLQFNFANSAFANYDANEVSNALNHDAGFGIDFSPYTENDIEAFTFAEIEGSAVIDEGAHTVTAEAVAGTDISTITPSITISTNASISPDTGVEQDFSSPVTYAVTAEDGSSQDWNVTITEETVAPTDIVLSVTSVDENSSAGTIVGTLSAVDANFEETFTFYVVAELGNDDWQSFDIDGDNLITTDFITLDFENKSSFTFELEVRDSENQPYSEMVTITLNDVNEAPTDILLSNTSVDESNPSGTFVGTLSPVDEDNGDSHTYSLKEGNVDNASFDISNGDLITNTELDFETQSVYNLEIIVTDQEGLTFEQEFAISVNNLPAQITSLELSNSSVDENVAIGNAIGSFATFGEDLSGSFTYDLVAGSGSDDNASFDISSDQLLVNSSLDFETQDSYSIRVMVDDGSLTFEKAFTITVNDVSEAPTDLTLSANSIAENNQIGDVIGAMSTTDEDAGESFTYSLVSGAGDTDNASFSIVGNELQAAEVFDFETQNSYSIRIETNDGNGGAFSKSFTIAVVNQNESILVANPIADQDLDEGFTSLEVDLIGVFTDQDGDDLTYEVSSDDETIVTVGNSGAVLTISEAGNFGSSTVTVTADDGSGVTTSDVFVVTVSNVNDAPVVANAIEDQNENEGFGSIELDLSATFSDEDGDNLTLSASSSDETVSTANLSGTILTLTEVGNGSTVITVTANDGNGGTVANEFTLTVNNVNDAPIVANAVADQSEDEGFGSIELDLSNTFSDEDGDNLTLSVSSSDEGVATASLSGTILTLTEAGNGSTTITVTANDGNGGSVSDEFVITVNNVNDAPVVINPLNDQTDLVEGFGSDQINYSDVFEDPDGDALTISVTSSDETVVTVEVIANNQIQINEVGIGTATITLTADDGNGASVSDEFIVTVSEAPNNAPIVVNPLDDQTDLVEGFSAAQINYSDVFEDPDGDALTISVTSSDETVVTVEVIANNQIQINEVGIGTASITLTADDGNGGSVSDEFIVTVSEAPNNTPVVVNPIGDQPVETEGFRSVIISYTRVFEDPDGDELTISASSSDESVVTVEIVENNQIQINEVGLGTAIIKLTADDGNGGVVSDTFTFTVEPGLGFVNEVDVNVYPNPVMNFLNIESSKEVRVMVHDLNGKSVQSGIGQSIRLDMRTLGSGTYILRINDGESTQTKRVLKVN
ncbi:cadherin domain-containing protein [Ekhidna sp.]|uniref:cadherin domain-containing protein n=1 Tax=Ekhidna sp. TaxID=2608089 RepID=UPI003CCBE820